MPKKIPVFAFILISLVILLGLSRQIGEALLISKRVDQAADQVSKLQDINNKLHKRLVEVEGYGYIEEVIRNKLNLTKPGETLVIIPDSTIKQVLAGQNGVKMEPVPNWEGWMRLLFH